METNPTAPPTSRTHIKDDNRHLLHHHHDAFPATTILVVVIPVVIIILLIVISLIVALLRRVKSSKPNANSQDNTNCMFVAHSIITFNANPDGKRGCLYGGNQCSLPSATFKGVQVFTYKELESATDGFTQANLVGKGGFGSVYRGMLRDGTLSAIKMLHREGKQAERAFRSEVDLLSRLQCPYLVDLLGYCADNQHKLLVFEYMSNGTLHNHLHPSDDRSRVLNWGIRLRIALDCARALEFLHEHTTPSVIHRDFKSTNILLDENFRGKVSDFGLAKIGSDKQNGLISTRVLGTTGYLAPEYASTGKLTTKSDVYSYGVVLLELLTGRVPIDTKRPPGEHVLVSWALPRLTNRGEVAKMVDPNLHGQLSRKDLIQVAAIAAMCVQTEADYRPLMTDVVQSLIPIVHNVSSGSSSGSFRFSKRVSPRS
ncbi:probable serine/threonine-protein kinase PBL7 [Cynara cardunculus var. scolymus]|uniref:probable serine/threonine-protein kinase PBL7 n=1 Tax=Cynara cardunculus var. scolymus TaxID=59895 RepID=UPI000D62E17A|nr:probable serine/threonine-protein kinase PBL7 [Cynara cardunculus var. scolymus]